MNYKVTEKLINNSLSLINFQITDENPHGPLFNNGTTTTVAPKKWCDEWVLRNQEECLYSAVKNWWLMVSEQQNI